MYRSQHRELARLAADITAGGQTDAFKTNMALGRLKGVLSVHLKLEDTVLYPAMMRHSSEDIRSLAQKYQREMGDLAGAFDAFYTRWTAPDAIENDAAGFQREWSGVLAALNARITAEENDLYAAVDEYVDIKPVQMQTT